MTDPYVSTVRLLVGMAIASMDRSVSERSELMEILISIAIAQLPTLTTCPMRAGSVNTKQQAIVPRNIMKDLSFVSTMDAAK